MVGLSTISGIISLHFVTLIGKIFHQDFFFTICSEFVRIRHLIGYGEIEVKTGILPRIFSVHKENSV